MTTHQLRAWELEATRHLIADLDALIDSCQGAAPKTAVIAAFERQAVLLPPTSKLLDQCQSLARRLRSDSATHIAESRLRQVSRHLQDRADDFRHQVET